MSQILVVRDVPADDVDLLTAAFKKGKATKVQKTAQPDGNFTLKATFPDDPGPK
jgi:hypothetical protein